MKPLSNPKLPICGATLALLLSMSLAPTWAQNKATELSRDQRVNLPPSVRDDLAVIGRYAETVNRKTNGASEEMPVPTQIGAGERVPRTELTPVRRMDTLIDPFEVSPQLRENRRGGGFSGLPAASKLDIRRRVRVKATIVTPRGRAAQLEIDGSRQPAGGRGGAQLISSGDSMTVMDGELVDLGDLGTYIIHISASEGVTLANPGSPQTGRINLR